MADAKCNPESFDDFLKELRAKIDFHGPDESGSAPTVELKFEKADELAPGSVAERVEPLRKLMEMRENLERLRTHLAAEKLEILERLLALASENRSNKTESDPLQE